MRIRANKDSTASTKENHKTPLTSKKRELKTASTNQEFICGVCKKSCRSNVQDADGNTLLKGMAETNKSISECMSKIESLNINLQESLEVNREKSEN